MGLAEEARRKGGIMKRLTIAALIPGLYFLGLSTPVHGDTQVLGDQLVRGVVFPEVTPGDSLGASVAGIGDFNGDGIDDFAIGAAPLGNGASAVYLVFGRLEFRKVFELAQAEERVRISTVDPHFGADVVAAGDVDRDGLADVWIYQSYTQLNPAPDPRLYLLYGSRDLPAEITPDEIGTSYRGAVFAGNSLPALHWRNLVAALRDFNRDGVPDVAIGKPSQIGPLNESGMVTVLFGSGAFAGALDLDALVDAGGGIRIIGSVRSDNLQGFGNALSAAGDVNGDGLSDFAVTDPKFRNGQLKEVGRVHLVYGSRSFPALLEVDKLGSMGVTVENPDPYHGYGFVGSVFGGGDLDGDGLAEFGFSQLDDGLERVLVVRGGKQLPPIFGIPQIEDGSLGFEIPDFSGGRLAPDEDGDGRPEFFLQREHEVFVLKGRYPMTAETIGSPLHRFQEAVGANYLTPVRTISSAGDVNADGIPDYLMGAVEDFGEATDNYQSRVFLVFGGFETRLLSVSGSSPAKAPLGLSVEVTISGTGFAQGVQVLFGDAAAPSVRLLDPHTLIASTPVLDTPRTVDLVVVHPDSRRATLTAAFSFVERTRKLSIIDLPGVVTFEPSLSLGISSYLRPEVLGDVNGDGVEDYALRASNYRPRGITHLIYGGKTWSGVVHDDPLNAGSVRFSSVDGAPRVGPVGDLNGDGRPDFAIANISSNEFAVVFESPPEGTEIALGALRGDAGVAFLSKPDDVLNLSELHPGADFDGDGEPDLVANTTNLSAMPPAIVILRGPFRPGDVVEFLDGGGRVIRIVDALNPKFMGERVHFVGDFNGDHRPDLAFHDRIRRAFVFIFGHQPRSDLIEIADLERDGLAVRLSYPSGKFDSAKLAAAGDLNGDGFADVLLKLLTTPANSNRGAAALIFGRKEFAQGGQWEGDIVPSGGCVLEGTEPQQVLGYDADLQDLDGNGRPDLVLGAPSFEESLRHPENGAVWIVQDADDLRGDFKITDVPRVVTIIEGEAPYDKFGETVRVLGDQDGDGIPELLVEAGYYDLLGENSFRGKTFLVPGRSLFQLQAAGFRRGDVDGNGKPEITDAVRLLGLLYLGEAGVSCHDAADADDTGLLDINDPVFILGYLFQGGLPPPAPGPEKCGPDPSGDDLPECPPAC
jgi:hypothetical protein